MNDDVEFLFVTGSPRAGTTMMMDWFKQSIPGDKLWLKESGVPNLAHHIVCALEFERRNHPWGFDLVEDPARRTAMMDQTRHLILTLYGTFGWTPGMRIVDKEPYFAPDGLSFFLHLRELFPQMKMICMLRNFHGVINSMLRRSWARGPFPRPNRISPFSYQLSNLENCLGDLAPGGADALTVQQPIRWSLRKCCASYRAAVNNIYDLAASGHQVVLLNYENLAEPDKVLRVLQRFTGIELSCRYRFAQCSQPREFDSQERVVLQEELYDTGTMKKYAELQELAAAPFHR
jgi:Sulfotransferase domain